MSVSFGMRAARKIKGGYELVPESKWFFINSNILQEIMDRVEGESDDDSETAFSFDWFDTALDANETQKPTAKSCLRPKDMLEMLYFVEKRLKSDPSANQYYEREVKSMIEVCEEAGKKGHLIFTMLG